MSQDTEELYFEILNKSEKLEKYQLYELVISLITKLRAKETARTKSSQIPNPFNQCDWCGVSVEAHTQSQYEACLVKLKESERDGNRLHTS